MDALEMSMRITPRLHCIVYTTKTHNEFMKNLD